jgi:hypothetical protein
MSIKRPSFDDHEKSQESGLNEGNFYLSPGNASVSIFRPDHKMKV